MTLPADVLDAIAAEANGAKPKPRAPRPKPATPPPAPAARRRPTIDQMLLAGAGGALGTLSAVSTAWVARPVFGRLAWLTPAAIELSAIGLFRVIRQGRAGRTTWAAAVWLAAVATLTNTAHALDRRPAWTIVATLALLPLVLVVVVHALRET